MQETVGALIALDHGGAVRMERLGEAVQDVDVALERAGEQHVQDRLGLRREDVFHLRAGDEDAALPGPDASIRGVERGAAARLAVRLVAVRRARPSVEMVQRLPLAALRADL